MTDNGFPSSVVPPRKPLPVSKELKEANAPPPAPWWDVRQFSRRKRIILAAAIAAIVLIALIIGLAVGLTRKKNSNLPLPTTNGPYTGDLTYYDPALGSCGIESAATDSICAVSHVIFDAASTGSNPNANPLCGKKLRVRRGESSVDVTVVDRCVGCAATDLDVSPGVFTNLADMDLGRVLVQWAWLDHA
ncbi:RlpA-like double-psi beta-barrel domain-containing protein [Aspergillus candidus]|uniref:RlpA-like double-psi beta-barrel-protein domain-containing protein-containing protein n=1 Tax=Aspergillus candidus TaxID=41067 RepID=A0A2I2FJ99_ASPCN|nr:hypothetical protein BDW47DRAFT_100672 [Aspergillus candidus]PLB40701.1 hypothetical protein BDW47DRAFT_100672 [Aspergillus candidus]